MEGGIGGDGYLVIRNSMGGKYAKFYNRNNSLTLFYSLFVKELITRLKLYFSDP